MDKRGFEKSASFRQWSLTHEFADCRLVQYCGADLIASINLSKEEIEQQIEGLVNEGFYVDWKLDGTRLFLRIWEYGGPEPDWDHVFAERSLSDILAVLRRSQE